MIVGAVMLDVQRSGCPIERTRTVPVGGKKLAEMQGVGPGPVGPSSMGYAGWPGTLGGGLAAADFSVIAGEPTLTTGPGM